MTIVDVYVICRGRSASVDPMPFPAMPPRLRGGAIRRVYRECADWLRSYGVRGLLVGRLLVCALPGRPRSVEFWFQVAI